MRFYRYVIDPKPIRIHPKPIRIPSIITELSIIFQVNFFPQVMVNQNNSLRLERY